MTSILFTGKHPPGGRHDKGGVKTWIETLTDMARWRGYDVHVWGPEFPLPDRDFDHVVLSNGGACADARHLSRSVLGVSHGIIPAEAPLPGLYTVYTSEEVRDHWGGTGPILRQPIDLSFWRPRSTGEPQALPRLLQWSYRRPLTHLRDAAVSLGLEPLHLQSASPERAREEFLQAQCVLATGRGALEAMACGIPTVICDRRGYQGELLDPATFGSMRRNYSGRGGQTPTAATIAKEVSTALRIEPELYRYHVEREHDSRVIFRQLEGLIHDPATHHDRSPA